MEIEKTTLKKLIQKYESGKLALPNFQREYIWKDQAQKDLLGSFLSRTPIGNFLWIEGDQDAFTARRMCMTEKENYKPSGDCFYLLDGQQRISTLYSAFFDIFTETTFINLGHSSFNENSKDWCEIHKLVPKSLSRRWFLIIDPTSSEEYDHMGYKNLHFDQAALIDPREAKELFQYRQIHRTKKEEWWTPFWKDDPAKNFKQDVSAVAITTKCLEKEKKLIPLWQLYHGNDAKSLHMRVLKKLADGRKDELIAEIGTDVEKATEILKKIEGEETVKTVLTNGDEKEIEQLWSTLQQDWVTAVSTYLISLGDTEYPSIGLEEHETTRAVAIFETINEGGTSLSVYDLLLAKMVSFTSKENLSQILARKLSEERDLTEHLANGSINPTKWCPKWMGVINKDDYPSKQFRNAFVSLLGITYELDVNKVKPDALKSDCTKQKFILTISSDNIVKLEPKLTLGLIKALEFLLFRCGVKSFQDLNFKLMILPLAAILSDDKLVLNKVIVDKLEFWYWTTLFSGQYTYRPNEQVFKDVRDLYSWINSSDKSLANSPFKASFDDMFTKANERFDEDALINKNDACHENLASAILQFVLSREPTDLLDPTVALAAWKVANGVIKLENHHLQPISTAATYQESSKELNLRHQKDHQLNSPMNRSYILDVSNRALGPVPLSAYHTKLCPSSKNDHFISSPTPGQTMSDDIFLEARRTAILNAISSHLTKLCL